MACVVVAALCQGCAYRFSNQDIMRPEGIRTIAVEAVYDTSREVLPHELMWHELQRAFAAEGHLKVVDQGQADALVRAHITDAAVTSAGGAATNGPEKDPQPFDQNAPPQLGDFRRLTQAGEFSNRAQIQVAVDVEIWSLRTRSLLSSEHFTLPSKFQAVHWSSNKPYTTRGNDHLRYEEATDAHFKVLAEEISRNVVAALLGP